MEHKYRIRLQGAAIEPEQQSPPSAAQPDLTPGFRVLAISAGTGNGWEFPADVLQSSLPCWDKVECFIDHPSSAGQSRSVRDLAGLGTRPEWDHLRQGILLNLVPGGPAGDLFTRTGIEWLAQPIRPWLGFSADLLFEAEGRRVSRILKIYSLDLVMHPARGGQFIDIQTTNKGEKFHMQEISETPHPLMLTEVTPEQAPDTVRTILAEPAVEPNPNQARDSKKMELQMCRLLLESTLAAARLPIPLAERIRTRFMERAYDPSELTQAVEDGRTLAAELLGGAVVAGPGTRHSGADRVGQMVDTRDQLQAACDDLLGAPREAGMEPYQPARLSGIRELYFTLTGDDTLQGGYHPERIRLATTADFNGLVKNSLNKVVAKRWEELGQAGYDWWQRIATVEHFNTLNQITGALVGTVGSLPEVAEGASYTELAVGDSPETAEWKKYGGYIPLTLELIDRDETRKLRAYPRELASAGLRKISALVAALFTQSGGIGPALADGGALFNNTAVTTAGGHKNLLTGALSAAEWEVVSTAVFNQPLLVKNASGLYGSGPRSGVNPRYLLVPRQLQLTAMKILYPTLENAASIYSENQQHGQPGDVVTVPEWTDANDWAAVVDPRIAPAVFIGERFGLMPEIFIAGDELSPTVFSNDEHRLKVRHFLAVWVNDFRPLHKSNVA